MASLSLLLHGDAGIGKTTLAVTAPRPRLVIDCEGGGDFIRQRKIDWDPTTGAPPPADDGTWDTCIVTLLDYSVVRTVYQWLNSGQHPFRSVILDSLTEAQKRAIDRIAGSDQMQTQHWGQLLRDLEGFVRSLRDLKKHPVKPLDAIVIVCLSSMKDGKYKAFVKGQLALTLPSFPDVVGYMFVDIGPNGEAVHKTQIAPYGPVDAKDRTGALVARYGYAIEDANIEEMLNVINSDPFFQQKVSETPASA